ncbi:MAG TPA: aldehyde dehydrogenase family protein [Acidimicrobiia bacterium]
MDTPSNELTGLSAGMPIVYGGNKVAHVSEDLARDFKSGDRLIVVQDTGALLHVPVEQWTIAEKAVTMAAEAFTAMATVTDEQVTRFFSAFAANLKDDRIFAAIAAANSHDVDQANEHGKTTTRLKLDQQMRSDMIAGLEGWATSSKGRGEVTERIEHEGWNVEMERAGLGVIGFVFEGRPNVFADATGVIRSGNTVVFRIGSDALGTARSIVEHALAPALAEAGLPPGAATLVDTASRAAGWAMFSDPRLALAVARGSGGAVSQLGSVARQTGTPVSLHGTGGAWIVASESADPEAFRAAVYNSLDRKVCNTLNTCCIVASRAEELVPVFLQALKQSGERRSTNPKLHVTASTIDLIPLDWTGETEIRRKEGLVRESQTEIVSSDGLGTEWEWEESPEVTLVIVADVAEAVAVFNEQSPRFAASLISENSEEHERFFATIDSPFVGDGFTRWVDGQYALNRPELGLSNWQFGRLFGRSGILSGDSVYTIRTRAAQSDPDVHR